MQICMQIFDAAVCPWHNEGGGSYGNQQEEGCSGEEYRTEGRLPARPTVVRPHGSGATRPQPQAVLPPGRILGGAIADWEGGKPVSEPGLRRIKELDRFRDRLCEVVAADVIPGWLDTPNEAFDGLKPLEVIERGEIDRLWNMIFYLESGVAS